MKKTLLTRAEAMDRVPLPAKVYKDWRECKDGERGQTCDVPGSVFWEDYLAFALRWLETADGKKGAEEAAAGLRQLGTRAFAPPEAAEAEIGGMPVAGRRPLDAQGLTEQEVLEKMDRAELGEKAGKNADKLSKIARARMEINAAKEKSIAIYREMARLVDMDVARQVNGGICDHVVRGIETLPKQYVDEAADELAQPKAKVRAVLAWMVPRLRTMLEDGIKIYEGRVEELRARLEAERNIKAQRKR